MKNLKDTKTKIVPCRTRGGKELTSPSAHDSPYVLSRLATPPHAINPGMSQGIDDATSINATHDDTSTLLDDGVPLGDFLDEQIARAKENEITETDEIIETDEVLETENLEKHLLDLALLDMKCLRYLKVMLWMRRQLEIFLLAMTEMILRNYYAN